MNHLLRRWIFSVLFLPSMLSLRSETVGFFFALDADGKAFAKSADSVGTVVRVGDRTVATYRIGEHQVHAVKMGAGCMETAISAATLLAKFRCSTVITVGPVGSLSNKWPVGEWSSVVSVVAYQRGTESMNGFVLSEAANFAVQPIESSWRPEGVGDRRMRVASGEIFSASDTFREKLAAQAKGDAIDMNLGGLLAACAAFEVPVTAWRVVSDRADSKAGEDFAKFVKQYDGRGGSWAAEWVRKLPANPADPRTHDHLRKLLDGGE